MFCIHYRDPSKKNSLDDQNDFPVSVPQSPMDPGGPYDLSIQTTIRRVFLLYLLNDNKETKSIICMIQCFNKWFLPQTMIPLVLYIYIYIDE